MEGPAFQLRAYVTGLERLERQIIKLNREKANLLDEAKRCGFNQEAIRRAVRRRAGQLPDSMLCPDTARYMQIAFDGAGF